MTVYYFFSSLNTGQHKRAKHFQTSSLFDIMESKSWRWWWGRSGMKNPSKWEKKKKKREKMCFNSSHAISSVREEFAQWMKIFSRPRHCQAHYKNPSPSKSIRKDVLAPRAMGGFGICLSRSRITKNQKGKKIRRSYRAGESHPSSGRETHIHLHI